MDREQAIDILYGMKADNLNLDDLYTKDKYDALEMAIKALEQEPKSEWEQDHELLKAYSDGANDILDKIRAEIADIYCGQYCENPLTADAVREIALEIIDKYKAESEDAE